ncbi:MAG: hypothetical protein RBS43_11565, partial [Candidatus Cloacimonas sp.]|nr:hypothetical protein [Candidatus Cloacimonas sp.]
STIRGLTHIFVGEDILFFFRSLWNKNISQTRSKGGSNRSKRASCQYNPRLILTDKHKQLSVNYSVFSLIPVP